MYLPQPNTAKIAWIINKIAIKPMITKWRFLCMIKTPANSRIVALGKK